jgi:hypothetical protein
MGKCQPESEGCKTESDQEADAMKVSMLQKRGGAVHTKEESAESLEARRAAILAELESVEAELNEFSQEEEGNSTKLANDEAGNAQCVASSVPAASLCTPQKKSGSMRSVPQQRMSLGRLAKKPMCVVKSGGLECVRPTNECNWLRLTINYEFAMSMGRWIPRGVFHLWKYWRWPNRGYMHFL